MIIRKLKSKDSHILTESLEIKQNHPQKSSSHGGCIRNSDEFQCGLGIMVEEDADLLKYLMCYSLILGGVIRGVGVVKQKRAFVRKPALLLSDSRELFGVFFHNNCGVVTTETK